MYRHVVFLRLYESIQTISLANEPFICTGRRPALGENSWERSAPPSLSLRTVLQGLRDWTLFQGPE